MLIYWVIFMVPALAALNGRWNRPSPFTGLRSLKLNAGWIIAVIVFSSLIGCRHEVGADWHGYIKYLDLATGLKLTEAVVLSEPGYMLLNWLSSNAGWGIYGVNLICGLIFMLGLAVFCRSMPRPWLAFSVAVPYLLVVVAMGYSRQGVAIGLVMFGLVALGRQKWLEFVVWVFLAATFHRSALIMLPIAALASTSNRAWINFWILLLGLLGYYLFIAERIERYFIIYIENEYHSEGALIRGVMNAVPAFIFLLWRKRFLFSLQERKLWFYISVISIALGLLSAFAAATTAVDRIGLYLLPLQLVVFSHLPDVFGRRGFQNRFWVLGVQAYYSAVLFVWLNYASHASSWLPYQFYFIEIF